MEFNDIYYKVEIPFDRIEKGLEELKILNTECEKLEEERKAWAIMPDTEKVGGSELVQKHQRELEAINAEWVKAIEETRGRLDTLHNEAISNIDEQVYPHPDDIDGDNAATFDLIAYGLIDRPEHLKRIVEEHNNAAFLNAAREYANKKAWDGFDYKTKEQSVREYVDNIFELFGFASSTPLGVQMMTALEDNELMRRAAAHDVLDCMPEV